MEKGKVFIKQQENKWLSGKCGCRTIAARSLGFVDMKNLDKVTL